MQNRKQARKQAGGTLMGIVIGLIIGLGIAVVVAIAITKTPVPFLNKLGKQEKNAEPAPGQVVDPNKPLYGKQDAAKRAAKELMLEAADDVKAADDSKANDGKELTKEAAKEATKPQPTEENKWTYYLQAGAFREQSDAENTRAKLALQGLEASISEKVSDNGPLYRVRLGPYSQLDMLNRVRDKLSDGGIEVAVIRIAK